MVGFVLFLIAISMVSFFITLIIYPLQFRKRIDNCGDNYIQSSLNSKKVKFLSSEYYLAGYYYWEKNKAISKTKIVLLVHGYGLTHRDYMLEICELVRSGYCVFAYDMTGCGESEGTYLKGFAQFVLDAEAAVMYLKEHSTKEIIALGHSTGAYAVAALLNIQADNLDKAVIISAFDVPDKFVRVCMQKNMKIFAYLLQFWIRVFEKIQFGNYALLSGKCGIYNYHKPVLVIQGSVDDQVEIGNSLYGLKDSIVSKNAQFILAENRGHYPTRIVGKEGTMIDQEMFRKIEMFIGGEDG